MSKQKFMIYTLALVALIVYLFVDAPEPLPDAKNEERVVNVKTLFSIVSYQNNVARSVYTKEIVGKGREVGMAFNENWIADNEEAGPLPALFLRNASKSLEKNKVPLSLFLGSDFPISSANAFKGIQVEKFNAIKNTKSPESFYDASTQRHTAMYPDFAISNACAECHNKHPDSPKRDWQVNDIMGATTWMYPEEFLTHKELLEAIKATDEALKYSYSLYLEKVKKFKNPPTIGDKWPKDGYFLPSVDVFMTELRAKSQPFIFDELNKTL